jgi:hypothetical protein
VSITPFDAAAILIVLAALLGYINQRFIGLPPSVGLTVMGAVASLGVIGLDLLLPDVTVNADIVRFLRAIDFHATLMDGMLSFLLFAGALHVDWTAMKRGRLGVVTLSTVGVLISTAIVAGGFLLITAAIGLTVPLVWCLVFGALISPTDPVAVMAVLKRTSVPPTLQATVAGESLYNDGVGVVLFSIILATALGSQAFEPGRAVLLFAREAGGGLALGLVLGWLAFVAMRSIDDYNVEVMISLAVVMGSGASMRSPSTPARACRNPRCSFFRTASWSMPTAIALPMRRQARSTPSTNPSPGASTSSAAAAPGPSSTRSICASPTTGWACARTGRRSSAIRFLHWRRRSAFRPTGSWQPSKATTVRVRARRGARSSSMGSRPGA